MPDASTHGFKVPSGVGLSDEDIVGHVGGFDETKIKTGLGRCIRKKATLCVRGVGCLIKEE